MQIMTIPMTLTRLVAKINLGKVAMLPWVNLYDFFEYPPSDTIDVTGGYKEYQGKVYMLFGAKFKASSKLTFPKPNSPFDIQVLKNGQTVTINFNGEIAGNATDEIITGGTYVYSAKH